MTAGRAYSVTVRMLQQSLSFGLCSYHHHPLQKDAYARVEHLIRIRQVAPVATGRTCSLDLSLSHIDALKQTRAPLRKFKVETPIAFAHYINIT